MNLRKIRFWSTEQQLIYIQKCLVFLHLDII